jgi:hypothetical protein
MMTRWLAAVLLVVASPALAEDDAQRRVREELERELNQMVQKAPSRVRVEFQPLDDPNLRVEELTILLDTKPLKAPTAQQIAGWVQDGPMPVATLDVSPERHLVTARVTVHNTASPLVVDDGDVRWRVSGDVRFDVSAGLEVRVIVTPVRDSKQADPTKRLKLTFPSQPAMISKLEDGVMPDAPKPKPVVVAAVDAGPSKAQLVADAALAKRQADEAQRQAALEAKRLAAEEKQRKSEAALEAKRAAAEDKKRKAEEAAEAKRVAAEEKKRKAEEAAEAKRLAQEASNRPVTPVAEVKPPPSEPVAKPTEPAVVEPPPLAVAEPVRPPEPPPVVPDASVVVADVKPLEPARPLPPPQAAEGNEGPPWLLIGGGASLAVVALIVVLVRRAGRVPELKD